MRELLHAPSNLVGCNKVALFKGVARQAAIFQGREPLNTRKLWSIRVIRIVLARSPARGDMENAGERLHTIRATGMAPLSRNCEKCRFLHFNDDFNLS